MGIKNDFQKKKRLSYVRKKYLEKSNTYKKNAINTFYYFFYDYWGLITMLWPGSIKWNTFFKRFINFYRLNKTKNLIEFTFIKLYYYVYCL